MPTINRSHHRAQLPAVRKTAQTPSQGGRLPRILTAAALAACLLLALLGGWSLSALAGREGVFIANGVTPTGICGGGVGTPC